MGTHPLLYIGRANFRGCSDDGLGVEVYGLRSPPSAVVAGDDGANAKNVAKACVMRAGFSSRQLALARGWAGCHAVVGI